MSAKGLTAWERWELASFDSADEGSAAESSTAGAVSPAPTSETSPAASPGPTAAEQELAALRQSTYDEAFAAGRHDGYADGHKEGFAAGTSAGEAVGRETAERLGREQAERLARLASALDEQIAGLDAVVANDLLELALEVARKVVGHTLTLRPEVVIEAIHEALAQLPVQHAAIHLHPEDASLARRYAGDALAHAGHRIHENGKLTRGDVVIECGGSQVDATLATRWRRVVESLGRTEATAPAPPVSAPATDSPGTAGAESTPPANIARAEDNVGDAAEPADPA